MDELKDEIFKIFDIYPENEISIINYTKIINNDYNFNKLIDIIGKYKENKEVKKLRISRMKNSMEALVKNFIKQDFKIEQCFKYVIDNQYRIRCKIWILYKRDLNSINGSDISDDTNEEMNDSIEFEKYKSLDSQIKDLNNKINTIEEAIYNPIWEERLINKITLKINERLSYLFSSIDNLSQSIISNKDNENKLNNSSILD